MRPGSRPLEWGLRESEYREILLGSSKKKIEISGVIEKEHGGGMFRIGNDLIFIPAEEQRKFGWLTDQHLSTDRPHVRITVYKTKVKGAYLAVNVQPAVKPKISWLKKIFG